MGRDGDYTNARGQGEKEKKNKNIIEGLKYIFKGLNNKLNFDGSVIRGE